MAAISFPGRKEYSPRQKNATQRSWPLWAKWAVLSVLIYFAFVAKILLSFDFQEKSASFGGSEGHAMTMTSSKLSVKEHGKQAMGSTDSEKITADPARVQKLPPKGKSFVLDKERAEAALRQYGASALRKLVTAYLEPPMNDTVPGTGNQGDVDDPKDFGVPPQYIVPLPLRTNTPDDLLKFEYPKLQTCHDVPSKIPVDRGLELDAKGEPILRNLGNDPTPDDFPMQEAPYCPVDADPYLPWLHDVFPSADGTKIHFIAQNKRRCKTGKRFRKDLKRLEPQVALMQAVSVERIDERKARAIAPELWHPEESSDDDDDMPRYRLAPFNESSVDGQSTRFICRFHTTGFSDGGLPHTVMLGETLSTFPIDYEFVSYRKLSPSMLTPKGKDNGYFWLSNVQFECPVPAKHDLPRLISSEETVLSDGTPTVYVDLIPIRTPPRYKAYDAYFAAGVIGPQAGGNFDPKERWGDRNVMPRVEASGRWENIPVCFPHAPGLTADTSSQDRERIRSAVSTITPAKKPHVLSACLWASASFRTRGIRQAAQSDTLLRLKEWIEFHLMVGFDHIYVYDNSGAGTNETSLAPLLKAYPPDKVTRIDWPSIVWYDPSYLHVHSELFQIVSHFFSLS